MLSLKWQQQLNPTPLRKSKRQSGKEKIWRLLYFTLLVRLIPKHVFTQRRKQIIWLKLGGLSYSQYNPNEREANWHRWCLKTKLTPAKSLDSFSFWQCTNSTHYISIEMTISGNHTNFILVEKLLWNLTGERNVTGIGYPEPLKVACKAYNSERKIIFLYALKRHSKEWLPFHELKSRPSLKLISAAPPGKQNSKA